jgi:hypothetical protein
MRYLFFVLILLFSSCSEDTENKKTSSNVDNAIDVNDSNKTEDDNIDVDNNLSLEETINIDDQQDIENDDVFNDIYSPIIPNTEEDNIIVVEESGENNEVDDSTTSLKEKMVRGRPYRVYKGDRLVETSNAIIRMTKKTDVDYTLLYLISGQATIYRSSN